MTDLVKEQLATEQKDVGKARERASGELERATETINRLLDSISSENRFDRPLTTVGFRTATVREWPDSLTADG